MPEESSRSPGLEAIRKKSENHANQAKYPERLNFELTPRSLDRRQAAFIVVWSCARVTFQTPSFTISFAQKPRGATPEASCRVRRLTQLGRRLRKPRDGREG
jgi:hypothetical protein